MNSEPIRLTFDASKAAWGDKYSHFVDVWVAYHYWQKKFGLDHNLAVGCTDSGRWPDGEHRVVHGVLALLGYHREVLTA